MRYITDLKFLVLKMEFTHTSLYIFFN